MARLREARWERGAEELPPSGKKASSSTLSVML
jgi:hypothetical protein